MAGAFPINADDIRLATDPGLETSGGGLRVKVANHLERVSGGLRLATTAVDTAKGLTGGGASAVSLLLDTGMEFAAGALRAKIKAGGGLSLDSNGYLVDKTQPFGWSGQHDFGTLPPTVNADPTTANHLARQSWVLAQISVAKYDFDIKDSVKAMPTGALPTYTVSGGGTILTATVNGAFPAQDGVTITLNDAIGVVKETAGNAPNNGIWVLTQVGDGSSPWILTRRQDANSASEVTSGMFFSVEEGTTLGSSRWVLKTPNPIVIGSTSLSFARFDAGAIQAGGGLTRTGETIDVIAADDSLQVNADSLQVKVDAFGGLMVQPGSGLRAKLAAVTPGLLLDGAGQIDVKRDTTGSGQLTANANGLRVTTDGVGLPIKAVMEEYAAATFVYAAPVSTHAISATSWATHGNIIDQRALLKNGLDVMTRVTGVPAATGEWRMFGGNLQIYGDITASGDTYRLRFHTQV